MRDSNNKLSGDYKIAYFDILSYMQGSNISANGEFSVRVQEDMMDMLLTAQENQLPIHNIIGKDIKIFCEDIVKTHNTKRAKFLEFLKTLNLFLCVFIFITLLFQVFDGYINLSTILTFFLCWFLFHYILNFIYKRLCLKFKGLKNKIICIVLISIGSMFVLAPFILLTVMYCNLLINGYYVIAFSLLLILSIHMICKKLDKNINWSSYLK
ncbi:DUF1048 domain-containing protein [[Clostridium] fimetarium]|uniref:DNA-binding ferritin-like protein (Dps family) n=1 Tax=[Clostridium] fimetarium TaxID=99656 RepID=A0A1I0NSI8_9FIRM|nr:DUF1048 domain-containing protein [[Clostridium] fimetarium]SEW04514.1 DNA-binding ferritin-like protein (Dps family) [[Clostridium] fimetarium]